MGTCHVRLVDGRAVIVVADKRIRVSRELVEVARLGVDGLRLDDEGRLVISADRVVRYQLLDDGAELDVPAVRIDA